MMQQIDLVYNVVGHKPEGLQNFVMHQVVGIKIGHRLHLGSAGALARGGAGLRRGCWVVVGLGFE